ncbi:MAG TPA: hypothetical protein VG276_04200 [Actinomycetes bacterium]|jgi:hypothetical protein|nr:hypothetical protein [Actinomycetes bacterium]
MAGETRGRDFVAETRTNLKARGKEAQVTDQEIQTYITVFEALKAQAIVAGFPCGPQPGLTVSAEDERTDQQADKRLDAYQKIRRLLRS